MRDVLKLLMWPVLVENQHNGAKGYYRVLRTVENRRQRECLRCRVRWWTREIPEVDAVLVSRIIDRARAIAAELPEV